MSKLEESQKLAPCGLYFLSAVVDRANLLQEVTCDEVRRAPANVIRQPPSVRGPDQVIGNDHERILERVTVVVLRNRKRQTSRRSPDRTLPSLSRDCQRDDRAPDQQQRSISR